MKRISVKNLNWSHVPFVVGGNCFCISCGFASAVAERFVCNPCEIYARLNNLVYIWLIAPIARRQLRPEMVAACATVLGGGRALASPNRSMGGRVGYCETSVWVVGRDLSLVGEVIRPCSRGWVRVFSAVAAGWVGVETIRGVFAPEARHD